MIPVDAKNLADRVKKRVDLSDDEDDELDKFFPRMDVGDVNDPAVILDCWGRIMAWQLPDIISAGRVVRHTVCFETGMVMIDILYRRKPTSPQSRSGIS